jgi:predicted secreted Zn-dependent protease
MPRTILAALLALSLSACASAPAAAGLRVSIDEAFYHVQGVTAPQLDRELARRGPVHEGARWQGLTDFRMSYSFVPSGGPGGCSVVDPHVSVRVVTTLPRWTDRALAAEGLREDWDLFLSRLREHEQGHQRIAVDAGERLLKAVAELRAPDCAALRKSAVELVAERRESVAREQEGWDAETEHGLDGDH